MPKFLFQLCDIQHNYTTKVSILGMGFESDNEKDKDLIDIREINFMLLVLPKQSLTKTHFLCVKWIC